ncbi:PqqD family protein [Sphingomonas sp. RT2P30]|uniref:PqqD family protein n=1 Tax=Parasphingomonas halimpatiens TaxID=3096162 RepID=UPI002FC70752
MTDMTLDDDSMIARRATLIAAQIEEQAMLMDLESGAMFQLNRTGARIWDLVEAPRTLADLVATLAQRFPDAGETLRDDVAAFVAQMRDTGLLEISA